jgi:nitroreductase
MDLFEAIAKRHSYRGDFKPGPVPREDLKKIVQAGIQAPSGCNAQSTTFVIVDDPAVMDEVRKIVPSVKSPALIVCVADPSPAFEDLSFEKEDCAAAVENMLLAIAALGYATVWLDGCLRRESRAEKLAKLLKVPAPKRVQVILPIGAPTQTIAQREKKPFAQRAGFNQFP